MVSSRMIAEWISLARSSYVTAEVLGETIQWHVMFGQEWFFEERYTLENLLFYVEFRKNSKHQMHPTSHHPAHDFEDQYNIIIVIILKILKREMI